MNEETVHAQVCQYLMAQYPNVFFNTDLSGIKLTIGQAKKVKRLRSGRAWPDIFISEPRGKYSGLFVELKKEGFELYNKDGSLRSHKEKVYKKVKGMRVCIGEVDHIHEQYDMLMQLNKRGYYANFACGFDEAKKVIDIYLNQ